LVIYIIGRCDLTRCLKG